MAESEHIHKPGEPQASSLACSPQAPHKQFAGNGKSIDPCSLTMGNSHLRQTSYLHTKGSVMREFQGHNS